jgi:hypothetical protein
MQVDRPRQRESVGLRDAGGRRRLATFDKSQWFGATWLMVTPILFFRM